MAYYGETEQLGNLQPWTTFLTMDPQLKQLIEGIVVGPQDIFRSQKIVQIAFPSHSTSSLLTVADSNIVHIRQNVVERKEQWLDVEYSEWVVDLIPATDTPVLVRMNDCSMRVGSMIEGEVWLVEAPPSGISPVKWTQKVSIPVKCPICDSYPIIKYETATHHITCSCISEMHSLKIQNFALDSLIAKWNQAFSIKYELPTKFILDGRMSSGGKTYQTHTTLELDPYDE